MPYQTVKDIDQLLNCIKLYNADADLAIVRKAHDFSAKAHEGQLRRSGEPYLQHPIAVAGVLTSLKTDVTAVVAGLLHDTLEDTQLSDLEAGDRIWITAAGGEFTGDTKPAVWIASGTGIAPFYSMLRSGLGEHKILLHGNRYLEQFHFYDEFLEALGDNYIRCCTRETGDGVYPGRVTAYLRDQQELDPALKYYLCGSAEMVVETRDILISKGVPFGHIISEIYF